MRTDHYKVSPTAIMCAQSRAECTDMPFSREIYEAVSKQEEGHIKSVVPSWAKYIAFMIPSIRKKVPLLEGRYYSTNNAIAQVGEGVPILELASGLSPRGLHLAGSHSIYLETDLDGMLNKKRAITEEVLRQRSEPIPTNHYFQTLNALDYDQLRCAGDTIRQVDQEKPIAIINEGLFMYLDDTEQKQLRDNLQRFFSEYSPNGAWITPDFAYRTISNPSLFLRWIKGRIEKRTGRKVNSFESDEAVFDFLNQGGLTVKFLPNEEIARNLSCIQKRDLRLEVVTLIN